MKFSEIPQLIRFGSWECNYHLTGLEATVQDFIATEGLQLEPDFQRGHVWTPQQKTAYIEYFLMGGRTGMVIYLNKPSWQGQASTDYDEFVCVDGLQRLTAIREFLAGKVKAFNQYYDDFGESIGKARNSTALKFNINTLQTKAEVLQWYVQMNAGGTPHTAREIERVRQLLNDELNKT